MNLCVVTAFETNQQINKNSKKTTSEIKITSAERNRNFKYLIKYTVYWHQKWPDIRKTSIKRHYIFLSVADWQKKHSPTLGISLDFVFIVYTKPKIQLFTYAQHIFIHWAKNKNRLTVNMATGYLWLKPQTMTVENMELWWNVLCHKMVSALNWNSY